MSELFQNVMNASFYGSIVIAAVLVLRLVLKKAPKKYVCLLWLLVGLRLLCPFEIESSFSLQPELDSVVLNQTANVTLPGFDTTVELPKEDATEIGDTENAVTERTDIEKIPGTYHTESTSFLYVEEEEKLRPMNYGDIAAVVWLVGASALAVYSLISYLLLKRRVREAVRIGDGVWECGGLDTAFILGYLRPRIYLPVGLSVENRRFILDHEWMHLRRLDHWFKLVGYAALAIHWFNPLVWVSYILLCRDIEMACDESVVKNMALEERKAYSAALLRCSSRHRSIAACPVAFGEVSVKQRILGVLNYRKKSFWFSLIAIIAIVFVAVCFLTSPAAKEPDLSFLNYENAVSLVAEQDVLVAVHYTGKGEESSIGIGMAEGETLARYLDSAEWTEKWFEPSDRSSPGSVTFNIADNYRINVYDRRFAAVEFDGDVRYYRIGKDDYAAAVDMVLPADQERLQRDFDINLGTATMEMPYWGITMSATDITSTGLTAIFTPTTGEMTDNLLFTADRFVERLSGDEWVEVEVKDQEKKRLWNWGTFYETPDDSVKVRIEWEEIYGVLPAGTYRLGQVVTMNDNGLGWNHTYHVEFEITGTEGSDAPDWGITLETANATTSTVTLYITQSKDLAPQKLYYTNHYTLERWVNGSWTQLEPHTEFDFDLLTTLIPQNQTTKLDVAFTTFYSQQPAGKYRLCLDITNYVPYKSGAGVDANGQPLEDTCCTYYAEFEIPGYSAQFADNELGALMQADGVAVTSIYLSMEDGKVNLSRADEIADVLELLKNVRYDPEPTGETADPEDYSQNYRRIQFNNPYIPPYLQFDENCETVWALNGDEVTAVYAVEDPEAVRELFERMLDSVKDESATASTFATRDEPWTWVKGLRLDAVQAVNVAARLRTRIDYNASSGHGYGGAMRTSRFEELLQILGSLKKDAFTPKEMEGGHSLSYWSYGQDVDWVTSVAIADGANHETVVLRCLGNEMELIFCGDTGGVVEEDGDIELESVQCWTVEDETLLAYMQDLMYHDASFYYYLNPEDYASTD